MAYLRECLLGLHRWGQANQVTFDAAKEHFSIVSTTDSVGEAFTVLGLEFDLKLQMGPCVHACAVEAGWRLRTLVRSHRFFTHAELVLHFKSHVLSYIEYRTPGIYHAATTVLREVDCILPRFLRKVGVTEVEALVNFRLAPLAARRDMAMLGLIHRTVLGLGPSHFGTFFHVDPFSARLHRRRHDKHLVDHTDGRHLCILARSALGLVSVYNLLPQGAVNCKSVFLF
jgi:hypothetical protein